MTTQDRRRRRENRSGGHGESCNIQHHRYAWPERTSGRALRTARQAGAMHAEYSLVQGSSREIRPQGRLPAFTNRQKSPVHLRRFATALTTAHADVRVISEET